MKLTTRNHYLNKLIDVKNTPNIKVITGVTRTKHPESHHEGVRIVDIARWLSDLN